MLYSTKYMMLVRIYSNEIKQIYSKTMCKSPAEPKQVQITMKKDIKVQQ